MHESQPPMLLNASHIKNILQISYSEASNILNLNVLPVINIGKSKRVLSHDFYRWLQLQKSNQKGNTRVTQVH